MANVPSPEEIARFRAAIGAVVPIHEAAMTDALQFLHRRQLRRHEHLLEAGDRAEWVALVVKGVLREYFLLANGSERTKSFVVEGQFSGSLADLLSGQPSRACIVAEEAVTALVIRHDDLERLGQSHAEWRHFARVMTERLLTRKCEREFELLALDADGRYRAFAQQYPGLESRVSAKHVATYLGITPEHLSRLRRRRASPARR